MNEENAAKDEAIIEDLSKGLSRRKILAKYRIGNHRFTRLSRELSNRLHLARKGKEEVAVPTGYFASKICTHEKGGEVQQRWVHTRPDQEMLFQAQLNALNGIAESGLPVFAEVANPVLSEDDLLTLYVLSDLHLGLYAWEKESSVPWDLNLSKKAALDCLHRMADGSPASKTGVLCLLGDFMHWDGLVQETNGHRHNLDGSCRFGELIETALESILCSITKLLGTHQEVKVLVAEGNHDERSANWLQVCLPFIFQDNPRVQFIKNGLPYYAMVHGEHLLGFHHGHKVRDKEVATVFSADPQFRKMWGNSQLCWVHTGHLHHQSIIEVPGAIVERHPTLSARDSYASRRGYTSWRCAHAITYHKKYGPTSRITVVPT